MFKRLDYHPIPTRNRDNHRLTQVDVLLSCVLPTGPLFLVFLLPNSENCYRLSLCRSMKTFLEFCRFSSVYLRRYWFRFSLGVMLGVLSGFSNGLTIFTVSTLLQRVTAPEKVQEITEQGLADKKAHDELREQGKPVVIKPASFFREVKQYIYVQLDPLLPLRGRPATALQCSILFAIFPLLALIRGMLSYGSTYLLCWSGERITSDVKVDAFRRITSQSTDYFNRTTTSELISFLESDTVRIRSFLQLGMSDLVQAPVAVVSMFLVLVCMDWQLTLLSLVFVPIFILTTRKIGKKIRNIGTADNQMLIAQAALALESFNNIRVTKAYLLEDSQAAAFKKTGDKMVRGAMKLIQRRELLSPILETISMNGVSAVFVFVVVSGRSVDTLGAFLTSLILFLAPLKRLGTLNSYFAEFNVGAERLLHLFALEPTIADPPNPKPFPKFQEGIRVRNVTFSYRKEGPNVLENFSIDIPYKHRLGLAGESGNGKSSLLMLLIRFWDVNSGTIELDGVDIREMRLKDLRSQIAYVTQEVQLFNNTIAENIRFGRLDATPEDVIEAAQRAHAHEFILALPNGYDTPVGERGVLLSGGQRQRIAIARAFVRNAPILILDEATASLDSKSESEVQKAIDDLAQNRTVICVAHRLSTLKNMDEVIVLQRGGHIEERGTFQQLLKSGGAFAKMAAQQGIRPEDPESGQILKAAA